MHRQLTRPPLPGAVLAAFVPARDAAGVLPQPGRPARTRGACPAGTLTVQDDQTIRRLTSTCRKSFSPFTPGDG
jgi:hypothetical protein